MKNILDLGRNELEKELLSYGYKKFNAQQVLEWLYRKKERSFDSMTNLSIKLREDLKKYFTIEVPFVVEKKESKSGDAVKFLLELKDSHRIESVIIRHDERDTLCVSTQAGCVFNCLMCATGKMGFKRNLTTSEIIGQFLIASETTEINNIVFMGMGEPLLNYDNFKRAAELLVDNKILNISFRRLTLSTCGIVPGIERLIDDDFKIHLSISLHAVNDKLRDSLVPANKKYNLNKLFSVVKKYYEHFRLPVTFEYVMIKNLNDKDEDLEELINILTDLDIECKVNLIPFNDTGAEKFRKSDEKTLQAWKDAFDKAKMLATIRKEHGADIGAACGQLAGRKC